MTRLTRWAGAAALTAVWIGILSQAHSQVSGWLTGDIALLLAVLVWAWSYWRATRHAVPDRGD